EQDGLDVIAETAAPGIDAAELATDQGQAELLSQVVGRGRVAQGGQEVAVDRAAVALEDLLLGGGRLRPRAAVGLLQERPDRGNLAEPVLGGGIHRGLLFVGRAAPSVPEKGSANAGESPRMA